MAPAAYVAEDGLVGYQRRGPWFCEGSMLQCTGMPEWGGGSEWVGGEHPHRSRGGGWNRWFWGGGDQEGDKI